MITNHWRTCLVVVASVALAACGKGKHDDPGSGSPPAAHGDKPDKGDKGDTDSADKAAPAAPTGNALAVKHNVPEFSGTYDVVFAQLKDGKTIVTFIRDCPKWTCDVGFEIEQMASVCPKAFTASVTVPGQAAGRFPADLMLAGPASGAATSTIEKVHVELTKVGNDGVTGSLSLDNTDSSVHATFKSDVCGQT